MTVLMKHPGLPEAEPATTTQEAFDQVWAKKGWQVFDPAAVTEAPKPGRRAENQEG